MTRSLNRNIGRCLLATVSLSALCISADAVYTRAAAAEAEPGTQIETVVVTARKRNENIQTTPVAVTAISASQLETRAAISVSDVKVMTPNVVIDQVNSAPNAAAIAIRGVSFEDIERSFDPAVGVFIDGVYLASNTGQLAHTFDFQSVQVLSGPQGILFGRNTPGGAIVVQRSMPTGQWGVNAQATIGNFGRRDFSAVVNLPAIADISTKLFYTNDHTDGYVHNAGLGNRLWGGDTYQDMGASFLWQPTEAFSLHLTAEHIIDRGQLAQASGSTSSTDLICALNPLFGPIPANQCNRNLSSDLYTVFQTDPDTYWSHENNVTAEINWTVADWLKLTSISNFMGTQENTNEDYDATTQPIYYIDRPIDAQQWSEEVRASGNVGDQIDYVFGGFLFHSLYSMNQRTWGNLVGGPAVTLIASEAQHSSSEAIFTDIDWKFMPKWRLTLGGRYTWDQKSAYLQNGLLAPIVATTFVTPPGLKHNWSAFTPKIGIDFQPTDDFMAYFSFSVGYRAGGFNGRASDLIAATQYYNPERVKSFELGAKTEWLDKRLQVNGDIFMTKYTNKQEEVNQASPPGASNPQETLVENAGSATIRGLELNLLAIPMEGLQVRGNLGLLDAHYDSFLGCNPTIPSSCVLVSFAQHKLRRAPHTTASAGFDYTRGTDFGDFTLSMTYSYSSVYAAANSPAVTNFAINDPRDFIPDHSNVDASITWMHDLDIGGAVKATLWGRNLTDYHGLNNIYPVGSSGGTPSSPALGLWTFATGVPPRTFGVTFGYKF